MLCYYRKWGRLPKLAVAPRVDAVLVLSTRQEIDARYTPSSSIESSNNGAVFFTSLVFRWFNRFLLFGFTERKSGSEGSSTIRKSRSVDAVTSNCYLNGEWPRADSLVAQAYFCPSNLTSDRSTQVWSQSVFLSLFWGLYLLFYWS